MKAFITGATAGIGGAVANRLLADCLSRGEKLEAVLTTTGRKPPPNAILEGLQSQGAKILHLAGDLANPEVCRDLASKALNFLGGLDIFVSNAGMLIPSRLDKVTVADWDLVFNANVRPTLILAQAFKPALTASQGSIVAVASTAGLKPHPGLGAYSAAKAALVMLCRQLAQEWAADGIRTNVVAPGLVITPLTEDIYRNKDLRERREKVVPLHRIAAAQEIADIVAFLTGPASSYMTGQVLIADGGLSDSVLGTVPGVPPAAKTNN